MLRATEQLERCVFHVRNNSTWMPTCTRTHAQQRRRRRRSDRATVALCSFIHAIMPCLCCHLTPIWHNARSKWTQALARAQMCAVCVSCVSGECMHDRHNVTYYMREPIILYCRHCGESNTVTVPVCLRCCVGLVCWLMFTIYNFSYLPTIDYIAYDLLNPYQLFLTLSLDIQIYRTHSTIHISIYLHSSIAYRKVDEWSHPYASQTPI